MHAKCSIYQRILKKGGIDFHKSTKTAYWNDFRRIMWHWILDSVPKVIIFHNIFYCISDEIKSEQS